MAEYKAIITEKELQKWQNIPPESYTFSDEEIFKYTQTISPIFDKKKFFEEHTNEFNMPTEPQDPFQKIAGAISGKLVNHVGAGQTGVTRDKQYKVPARTKVLIPRVGAAFDPTVFDISNGTHVLTEEEVTFYGPDLLLHPPVVGSEEHYFFRIPENEQSIPYIVVPFKLTMVVYIIEIPGDLNEEVF